MEQVDHQVGIGIDLSTPSMACLGSNISERECADRLPIFFVVHVYIICFRCFVDLFFLCFLLLFFSSSSYSSYSKFFYPFILYLLIFLASRTHFLAVAHAGPVQGLVFPLLQESY